MHIGTPLSPTATRVMLLGSGELVAIEQAGLSQVELFVKGSKVWFSEVSPRPHDTGMVTMC